MWATVTASSHDGIVYDEDLAREIDQFVLHILPCHQSPALTLAIVKEGTVVLTKGYGFTSTNMSVNTTSKTRFAIGSLTKAFTATLVAKWVIQLVLLNDTTSRFYSMIKLVLLNDTTSRFYSMILLFYSMILLILLVLLNDTTSSEDGQ
ncbi:hypothetical protein Btru_075221 [Bulinus truncatus]|nr:hypothetical protein Btru_075221 [Bulinus truncatus]